MSDETAAEPGRGSRIRGTLDFDYDDDPDGIELPASLLPPPVVDAEMTD